jgi:two-component system, sensor histidine kinase LadS
MLLTVNNFRYIESRRKFLLLFGFLFAIFCTSGISKVCIASESIFSPFGEQKQSIRNLEYLVDEKGDFTIGDIVHTKSNLFKPLQDSMKLGYEYKEKTIWVRFTVNLGNYSDPYWFLTYDYEHISDMDIFISGRSGFRNLHLSDRLPMEGRSFAVREYVFKIPSESEPTTYYVRLAPKNRLLKIDFSWSSLKGTVESVNAVGLVFGLFFGGLVAILFYNIALYSFLRDRAYLYYIYYLGCFTLTFLHIYGYTSLIIDLNPFFEQLFAACGYGTIHGMILFARHFLILKNLDGRTKWIDKYLSIFLWIFPIGGILAFAQPVGTPFQIINYLIIFVLPVLVLSGIVRWRQGYAPAGPYLFGWAVFACSIGLVSLRSIGLLPSNVITNYAVMFASIWDAIIFSAALAYRIKITEREKNNALDERSKLLESETARLEKQVAERTESLQASLEARRMILANASHELRSPVNALRLLLDSTSQSGALVGEIMPNVTAIAAHMSTLVENLLLLDVDQRNMHGGIIQDFELGREIYTTGNMVEPLRHGSKAIFKVDTNRCDGFNVRGDLTSLRRIIINLLTNAFKFTQDGVVSLLAWCESDEYETVTCTIRVTDTGRGIPTNMHENIFDAFITSGPNGRHTGTGLGLAISRQLAINLNGTVRLIRSVEDEGSEFECVVAFKKSSNAAFHSTKKIDEISHRRLNVLVAEDDPNTAQAVLIIIKHLQHDVTLVTKFDELQDILKTSHSSYDIALIDHRLPGGNGLDVIRFCREKNLATDTRMILMTADVTPEMLNAARTICDDIVTKPTTANYLQKLLGKGISAEINKNISINIVDPGPLRTLKSCNADIHVLTKMFEGFISNVIEILGHVHAKIQQTHNFTDGTSLQELVHRVRSSCTTIGAVALDAEFKKIATCASRLEAEEQYQKISDTFEMTRKALKILLSEMAKP